MLMVENILEDEGKRNMEMGNSKTDIERREIESERNSRRVREKCKKKRSGKC